MVFVHSFFFSFCFKFYCWLLSVKPRKFKAVNSCTQSSNFEFFMFLFSMSINRYLYFFIRQNRTYWLKKSHSFVARIRLGQNIILRVVGTNQYMPKCCSINDKIIILELYLFFSVNAINAIIQKSILRKTIKIVHFNPNREHRMTKARAVSNVRYRFENQWTDMRLLYYITIQPCCYVDRRSITVSRCAMSVRLFHL